MKDMPVGFTRNIGVLAGGTVGAQLILIACAPILTRLYTPTDFGLLAIFTAILTTVGTVVSLRYQLAIPIAEDDDEAASAIVLALSITLVTALLISALALAFAQEFSNILKVDGAPVVIALIPAGLLILGVHQVVNCWSIRTKAFREFAKVRIAQAIMTAVIQVIGASAGATALLVGQVAGEGGGGAILGRKLFLRFRPSFTSVTLSSVKAVLVKYRALPIYSTWGGLANSLGTHLPMLLFAGLFSPTIAGLYALGHRALSVPISIVGKAVSDVTFSGARDAIDDGTIGRLVSSVNSTLLGVWTAPTFVLIVVAPDLFEIVFGEEWRETGEFARFLAVQMLFKFAFAPLSTVFIALGRQRSYSFFQVAILTAAIVGIAVGYHVGDAIYAVAYASILTGVCYLAMGFMLFKMVGVNLRSLLAVIMREVFLAGLVSTPLFLGVTLSGNRNVVWTTFLVSTAGCLIRVRKLFPPKSANSYSSKFDANAGNARRESDN